MAGMIAMPAALSTSTCDAPAMGRRAMLLGAAVTLSGCAAVVAPGHWPPQPPTVTDGVFTMSDGARLPYRTWRPDGPPDIVVLALHGFNDSRDAWEIPAPSFAAAGMAVYAPDQRGFGAAPGRGFWPGGNVLADDALQIIDTLRHRHPGVELVLMGESMGGAVLMDVATRPNPPDVAGYVLVAPAVWGRARMNIFMRSGLWLAATLAPGMEVSRPPPPIHVFASDNIPALIRLGRDPLTLLETRFDTLRGLVDLMDTALAAARRFRAPALFMYGGKDELVPKPATLATWRALPGDQTLEAFYPNGWHLLMRDLDRAAPIGDAIAWIQNPHTPLPSGADQAATKWLAAQS
ncbi:MAG TPA: alpha/beta fold hydrolase [Acetobacteraceae bacterium]|jgi:alpha-beta hydrolase superfamily lysophospholipase